MEQGFNTAIVGAGASGCISAYFLLKAGFDVTIFDYTAPLKTLLPTGGGRCNLAHAEYDFRELASNYPRGEKFLYSVFSKFGTYDTLALFDEIGVETYTQEDGRIFPTSNSSKDVRIKILEKIKNANFILEKVNSVNPLSKGFKVKTEKAEYFFQNVIISAGGKGKNITGIQHTIVPRTPSLVGLNCDSVDLSGIVLNNVFSKDINYLGNILFTHFGVSGPLIYRISSIKTKDKFPYELTFDLYPSGLNLQELLNKNPHKDVKNILSETFPHRFAEYISGDWANIKAHKIDGRIRDIITDKISNFKIKVFGTNKGEETVTAGGYDLKEVNSSTMESKVHPHLFFTGECLDIDGFCGGYNLQNAWSTAFVASNSIINYKD